MIKHFTVAAMILAGLASVLIIWAQRRPNNKWTEIASRSDLIVVGVIDENINSVIRPEHFKAEKDPSEPNTIQLPDPNKYLVGRIYQVNVSQYLKSPSESERAEKIGIFQPGGFPVHGDPALVKGKQYILFLKRTNNEDQFENTMVLYINPDYTGEQKPFEPESTFTVVSGERGVVKIESEDSPIIREIKAAAKANGSRVNEN